MATRRRLAALTLLAASVLGILAARAPAQVSDRAPSPILPGDDVVIILPPRPLPRRHPMHHEPVRLTAASAAISIDEQAAGTRLELTLSNPSGIQQEAVVMIPVPDGVAVRSLEYDGVGPEPVAKVLPRDEARRIYDAIVNKMRDPALVEFAGTNMIRTSAFPIPPGKSQKLAITFEQVLGADGDRVDYWLPRSESLAQGDVSWTISAMIKSSRAIAGVYSASHEVDVIRDAPGQVRVKVAGGSQADAARGSFRLSYLLQPRKGDGVAATLMAYPDADVRGGQGGYFLLLAGMPPTPAEVEKQKREVVLVLDRSGSMRGEKIEQVRNAALQVVEGLEWGEAFNIIDYSDSIAAFADKPVIKDQASLDKARAYIRGLQANGGTNLHDALIEAMRSEPTKAMLPLVIFLTDGLPTVGERSEVKIRDDVKAANKFHRRVFTFGVGFDVNSPLLSGLGKASRGASTFVLPQEDVEVKVSQVFRRLNGPVLAMPRLTVLGDHTPGGMLRELMPGELPDVFEGDQIVVLGQYASAGNLRLRLEGEQHDKKVAFEFDASTKGATVRNAHVARLWARAKIAMMVDEIRQAGASGGVGEARMKELADEIVRLSTKWGILTEYTSFLATPEAERLSGEQLREGLSASSLTNLSRRAEAGRSGTGGVNQEANLQRLMPMRAPSGGGRGGVTAAPAPTTQAYLDADMKKVEVHTIQQNADRAFYFRNNRWVDSRLIEKEQEKPDVTIELGTPAYSRLVDELVAEGRQSILANQGEIYILHQNQRVLVKNQ